MQEQENKITGDTQEDWEKFTKNLLGEKTTIEQLEEDARIKNLADDKVVLKYADTPKKLEMPTIGYHVWYTPLSIEDRLVLTQITDLSPEIQRDKRNRKKVYLILKKANDGVFTEDVCDKLAANIVDTILMRYDEEEDSRFLLPLLRRRLVTSSRTQTPSEPSS